MSRKSWKKFIKQAKADYYRLGSVACPAFNGELVYFDWQGFNHLLIKHRAYRPVAEQRRKIILAKHAPEIIRSSNVFVSHSTTRRNNSAGFFWSFKSEVNNRVIIVVIRQIGRSGQKHFFSIMDKKLPRSAQTP